MWPETGTKAVAEARQRSLGTSRKISVTSPELIQERRNLFTPKCSKNRIRFCACSITDIFVVSWILNAN